MLRNNGVCICLTREKIIFYARVHSIFTLHQRKAYTEEQSHTGHLGYEKIFCFSSFFVMTIIHNLQTWCRRKNKKIWYNLHKVSNLKLSTKCFTPKANPNPNDPIYICSGKMWKQTLSPPSHCLPWPFISQTHEPLLSLHSSLPISLFLCKLGMLVMLH